MAVQGASRPRPRSKVLREKMREGKVTLVHGSRDQEHNAAAAWKEFLEQDIPDS